MADLGRHDGVLQQQRKQNGGISRECIQHRVLLGGVEEYLANGAVRKIANVHPVTVTGVLDVERDRTAAMRQASPSLLCFGNCDRGWLLFNSILHSGPEAANLGPISVTHAPLPARL